MKTFKYDVFISYSHKKSVQSWVQDILVPRLEEAGLSVAIDYRDFRLGESLILEMERAVEQSRYTLVVLTPAYLKSEYTTLENIISRIFEPENARNRLLAITNVNIDRPNNINARLWMDLSDSKQANVKFNVLIQELFTPLEMVSSRLAGDPSTDAPPPDKKKNPRKKD